MPANRQLKKEKSSRSSATRQKILNAAAKLFREQGFSATTLRQIAGRAKIKAGSVYYYFDSKEQILDEVLDVGIKVVFEAVEKAVDALPENASGRARIEAAVAAHLNTLLKYSDYTSANVRIFRQVSRTAQNRNRAIRRAYSEYWNGLLRYAKKTGEISKKSRSQPSPLVFVGIRQLDNRVVRSQEIVHRCSRQEVLQDPV